MCKGSLLFMCSSALSVSGFPCGAATMGVLLILCLTVASVWTAPTQTGKNLFIILKFIVILKIGNRSLNCLWKQKAVQYLRN